MSETAERYMDLVLSPQHIHILHSREKLVYLMGEGEKVGWGWEGGKRDREGGGKERER